MGLMATVFGRATKLQLQKAEQHPHKQSQTNLECPFVFFLSKHIMKKMRSGKEYL